MSADTKAPDAPDYRDTVFLPQTDFPIRQVQVTGSELPLSRARNTVAAEAKGDCLVFLDVDCIPAPELIAGFAIRTAVTTP